MDPGAYDYREQALALIFFPYLLDRFWQNTRRGVGWKVQYAGAVEMQRRLAPTRTTPYAAPSHGRS